MNYFDYGDYYEEPSEADKIIEDAIGKLGKLLKDSVKKEIEKASSLIGDLKNLESAISDLELKRDNLIEEIEKLKIESQTKKNRYPTELINRMIKAVGGDLAIGQTVYVVKSSYEYAVCPVCEGKKTVVIENKGEFGCPKCNRLGKINFNKYFVSTCKISDIRLSLCFHENNVNYWSNQVIYLDNSDFSTARENIFLTLEEAEIELKKREETNGNTRNNI
jgi:hypothetical protein